MKKHTGKIVTVSHKGKKVLGKIVRYVAKDNYYVVYVGEYESIEIPGYKIKKELELEEKTNAYRSTD